MVARCSCKKVFWKYAEKLLKDKEKLLKLSAQGDTRFNVKYRVFANKHRMSNKRRNFYT